MDGYKVQHGGKKIVVTEEDYNEFKGDDKLALYSTNDFPRIKIDLQKGTQQVRLC